MVIDVMRGAWEQFVKVFPVVVTVVITVLTAALIVGQRLETPEQKADRIQLFLRPMSAQLDRLEENLRQIETESAASVVATSVMQERVKSIQEDLAEIKSDVRKLGQRSN